MPYPINEQVRQIMFKHFTLRRIALTLSAGLLVTASTPASTQTPQYMCMERSDALKQLSTQYSEAPVAMGIANNGGVLEILVSQTGNSWTIMVTMPSGISCLVAAGNSWESLPVMSSLDPPA